ncbi:MAG: hypothetical protein Q9228_007704 [Teloschistes exilis]
MLSRLSMFASIFSKTALCFVVLSDGAARALVASDFGHFNITDGVSTGGGSRCFTGQIDVTASATNIKINFGEPPDQLAVTEFNVESLQVSSDLAKRLLGGPNPISGTWSIYSSLCVPSDPVAAKNVKTVQILTHGDSLSSTYWDIASDYSYIDAATTRGYATFSYDRIGVGKSEHPDPIQIVQGPLNLEILHAIVTRLRNGHYGQLKFTHFIGVGHSAGSTVTQGVTTKYPKDFDAIILTGTSTIATYVPLSLAAFNWQIAAQASPKFKGLPTGYWTQATSIGIQFSFFRYPNFDPKSKPSFWRLLRAFADPVAVFDITVQDKDTNTIGELLTLGSIVAPSPGFTGPVDVVLGENDLVFCGGNCSIPTDQSAAVQPLFYPNAAAGSSHYLAPGAGHSINAHFSRQDAWNQQFEFLRSNGF